MSDSVAVAKIVTEAGRLVLESTDPGQTWDAVCDLGEAALPGPEWERVRKLDILSDIYHVKQPLLKVITLNPIPPTITCLFFGLFPATRDELPVEGFYISGLERYDFNELATVTDMPYLPDDRFLQSRTLDALAAIVQEGVPAAEILERAVMLAAAGLIVKFLLSSTSLKLVVGFDEGDVLELN